MSGARVNCAGRALPGDLVVAEARRWLGTPYRHQARCRGAGTDCLGLVLGLWEALLGPLPEVPPAYSADWDEAQGQEALWRAARRHLLPRPPLAPGALPAPGEVLLLRMRAGAVAKHLGIAARGPAFIHSYSGHGVVESPLSAPWARRIVARFAFPERTF